MSVPHTPGPWIISNPMTGAVVGPEGWMVASVYGDNRDCTRDARQDANSYLIAAAPSLLAFAKQYASECAACSGRGFTFGDDGISGRGPDDMEPTRYACEDCADIRAVIAKAEGKQS